MLQISTISRRLVPHFYMRLVQSTSAWHFSACIILLEQHVKLVRCSWFLRPLRQLGSPTSSQLTPHTAATLLSVDLTFNHFFSWCGALTYSAACRCLTKGVLFLGSEKNDASITGTLVTPFSISFPLDIHIIRHLEWHICESVCSVLLQCHVFYNHLYFPCFARALETPIPSGGKKDVKRL